MCKALCSGRTCIIKKVRVAQACASNSKFSFSIGFESVVLRDKQFTLTSSDLGFEI